MFPESLPDVNGWSWDVADPALHPSLVFISRVTLSSGTLLSEPASSPLTLVLGGLGKSCYPAPGLYIDGVSD